MQQASHRLHPEEHGDYLASPIGLHEPDSCDYRFARPPITVISNYPTMPLEVESRLPDSSSPIRLLLLTRDFSVTGSTEGRRRAMSTLEWVSQIYFPECWWEGSSPLPGWAVRSEEGAICPSGIPIFPAAAGPSSTEPKETWHLQF